MTGELTAQGLIDFRSPTLRAVPVVTFSFPGGNTRRYAIKGAPVQSSLGIFRDRMSDIGDIDYRLSDPRGGLQAVSTFFQVDDIDGDIRSLVQRYGQNAFVGSVVVLDYATTSPIADWPRIFTGVVVSVDPAPGLQWRLFARVDDRPLTDSTFALPTISSNDYPNVLAPVLESIIPVALGLFDSRDGTAPGSVGSINLLRLEEASGTGGFPYRYLLAAPYVTHVARCANNGTTVSSASWVRTYTLRNGMSTSEVWFSSDPGASAKMTADIMGVGADVAGGATYNGANGTGAPIVNIVGQIRWLLRNYVWSAYRTGAFAADPYAIGTTTWDAAEAWAEQRRFRGSVLIKDIGQKPLDVFNAFCQWAWIRAGWSRTGKLNLYPFTDEDAPYFGDTRWIRYALRGSEDAFLPAYPHDTATQNIRSISWFVPSSFSGRSRVLVRDSRLTGNGVTDIDHQLGSARQEFQDGYPGPTPIILALNASRIGLQGDAIYQLNDAIMPKWRDINWSPETTAFDFPYYFRTASSMVAPVGKEPKWLAGILNGHGVVRFDGVNDYMDGANTGLVSLTDFTVWVVCRVNAAPTRTTPGDEAMIIGDSAGGFWGLCAYLDTGVYYMEANNYDGAQKSCRTPISLNTWYVVRFSHVQTTLISLSIDNWTQVTAACGATTATAKIRLGAGNAGIKCFNGDIAAVFMFNNGILSAQGAVSGTSTPGLGANYDIYQALRDRYRI